MKGLVGCKYEPMPLTCSSLPSVRVRFAHNRCVYLACVTAGERDGYLHEASLKAS